MPVAKVHRISAYAPDDASGIAEAIERGDIDPRGIMAVFGKTEGQWLRQRFQPRLCDRDADAIFQPLHAIGRRRENLFRRCPGGTEGAMAPHWTIFERADGNGKDRPGAGHRPRAYDGRCPPNISDAPARSKWSRTACAPP